MQIIGLIGEPAAGKSTVMRDFIARLGRKEVVKEGLVAYTLYAEDKVMVAGIYDEQVFSGTDRLSKGVWSQVPRMVGCQGKRSRVQ